MKPSWGLIDKRAVITQKKRLVVAKGERGGSGMNWEFRISRCKLFHLGWMSTEVLLYGTGDSLQSPGIDHDGR